MEADGAGGGTVCTIGLAGGGTPPNAAPVAVPVVVAVVVAVFVATGALVGGAVAGVGCCIAAGKPPAGC